MYRDKSRVYTFYLTELTLVVTCCMGENIPKEFSFPVPSSYRGKMLLVYRSTKPARWRNTELSRIERVNGAVTRTKTNSSFAFLFHSTPWMQHWVCWPLTTCFRSLRFQINDEPNVGYMMTNVAKNAKDKSVISIGSVPASWKDCTINEWISNILPRKYCVDVEW